MLNGPVKYAKIIIKKWRFCFGIYLIWFYLIDNTNFVRILIYSMYTR